MPTSSNPKRDKQHSNYEFIYHPKKRLNQKKLNLKDKSYLEKKVIIDDKNNFSFATNGNKNLRKSLYL